ncbi:hypothetical protein ABIE27_004680 [Paenibacillus sp. 4624]|uniref:hypothetical protein n=1 Tax=Paenibacillus sp. 4624 TaxID=3156453 RepID=UPI003D205280
MDVGARIYYEKSTGNVILNTGQRSGDVIETTVEQDFDSYKVLAERVQQTVGMVQLDYGAYSADYAEGGVITRIDLDTLEPLFTYPNPVDPEKPTEPRPALSEQVGSLGGQMAEMKLQGIENQTVINSLGGELTAVKMQSIQQQQTITSLGQELAETKLEIIQLKGGETA